MHLNTVFAAVAAFIATGANAAAFQSRQKPNPPQIELATYGNGNCANQHFNGFSMQYVVPADDIGKCRTFMQDKDYHVGSIGVMFTESYQNDTCACKCTSLSMRVPTLKPRSPDLCGRRVQRECQVPHHRPMRTKAHRLGCLPPTNRPQVFHILRDYQQGPQGQVRRSPRHQARAQPS